MPISEYQQSILNMRQIPLAITDGVEALIDASLRDAYFELQKLINESRRANDQIGMNLWRDKQMSVQRLLGDLAISVKSATTNGVQQAITETVDIRETETNALLREVGEPFVADFAEVPQRTHALLAQRQDKEGLKLDANTWAAHQHKAINKAVRSAVAQGEPVNSLAMRLQAFMFGEGDDKELRAASRAARQRGNTLGTSISAKAKRLARTEILNAAWESSRLAADESPLVRGVKWNLSGSHPKWDVCDILAQQDMYGLGSGVYPPSALPTRPHPNDLCFQTDVLRPEEEWASAKETTALQGNPNRLQFSGGQGTEHYIKSQSTLASDLIVAAS